MYRNNYKPQSVSDAKQQLRQASMNIDYLAPIVKPIKKNPVSSMAGSFIVGYALNKVIKKALPPSLFSLLLTAASKM